MQDHCNSVTYSFQSLYAKHLLTAEGLLQSLTQKDAFLYAGGHFEPEADEEPCERVAGELAAAGGRPSRQSQMYFRT